MVYKIFDEKSSSGAVTPEANYQLSNELYRQIIRKLKKKKFIHLLETIFGV